MCDIEVYFTGLGDFVTSVSLVLYIFLIEMIETTTTTTTVMTIKSQAKLPRKLTGEVDPVLREIFHLNQSKSVL